MRFRDNVPGTMDERGAVFDSTRDLAMPQDATLGEWFSRPIQIADFTWDVDDSIFQRFNPWTLFWENARNTEKISNYHLLRAKLHVKILINGNAFYYGRALAAYEPLSPLDNTSPKRTWVPEDFIRGTQRMHVFINPTFSTGGSLELPFFWNKNNWVVGANDWRNMGEVVIASLNDLKHANGGTDPLNISVLAWAEDVKFAIPTRSRPAPPVVTTTTRSIPEAGVPSGDEHEKDVISRPASNVARVAGALSDVPVIGSYAKATQMGATMVAKTAKMFGLSAPNDLHYSLLEPRAKHSLAVTDTSQSANKLTVDSKQEITIDPVTTGIRGTDELPIGSIAGRESYLTTFTWPVTDGPGTHLWNSRVDPGLKGRNGAEWHFPACAFAALPFQYWRGSMRFRFQVVASEYHKGRLRISYDPRTGSSNGEFNTQYTTIHDIAETKDFTIDVGWGQNVPYRESLGWYSSSEYGTTPLGLNLNQGNGVLCVNILNKLSAPATATEDIQINVFISMLDDFEVAAPDDKISYFKVRPPVSPALQSEEAENGSTYSSFMSTLQLKKKSMPEAGIPEDDTDDQQAPITDPPAIDTMADTQIDVPLTTKVFMGEVIGSFRTLLKRGYLSETRIVSEPKSGAIFRMSRSSFPTFGGFITGQSPATGSMLSTFADGRYYNASTTTLMNYLGRAFLGWRGSTRWTVDTSSINHVGGQDVWTSIGFKLSRNNEYSLSQFIAEIDTILLTNVPQYFNGVERGMDTRGVYLGSTKVNPIQTVEVPYLLTDRFTYTFRDENYENPTPGPGWDFSALIPSSGSATEFSFLRFYVSAGEDFNLFFFNGLPPVYYEDDYALDGSS
jgi:hypothetical protein